MGRWQDLLTMLGEHRIGFRLDETMSGTHRFVRDFAPGDIRAGTELPLAFSATWGHPRLEQFINPLGAEFCFNVMEGTVTAGGICVDAPMKGTLELRYLRDASIRYSFEFAAHDRCFRYVGEKRHLRPWNLHRTHTTCYGTVTDLTSGELVSDSVVYFDLKLLPRMIASLRFG